LRMGRIISSDQNAKSAKAAKHTSLRKIIDDTTNPIGQQADIEVDEQSKIQLHLPQVMAKLRLVHPVNPLERLHLDDDRVLDQKVQPKAARKPDALVLERQWFLLLKREAAVSELKRQARLVRRLEHAGSELAINIQCGTDDHVRQAIEPVAVFLGVFHGRPDLQTTSQVQASRSCADLIAFRQRWH